MYYIDSEECRAHCRMQINIQCTRNKKVSRVWVLALFLSAAFCPSCQLVFITAFWFSSWMSCSIVFLVASTEQPATSDSQLATGSWNSRRKFVFIALSCGCKVTESMLLILPLHVSQRYFRGRRTSENLSHFEWRGKLAADYAVNYVSPRMRWDQFSELPWQQNSLKGDNSATRVDGWIRYFRRAREVLRNLEDSIQTGRGSGRRCFRP